MIGIDPLQNLPEVFDFPGVVVAVEFSAFAKRRHGPRGPDQLESLLRAVSGDGGEPLLEVPSYLVDPRQVDEPVPPRLSRADPNDQLIEEKFVGREADILHWHGEGARNPRRRHPAGQLGARYVPAPPLGGMGQTDLPHDEIRSCLDDSIGQEVIAGGPQGREGEVGDFQRLGFEGGAPKRLFQAKRDLLGGRVGVHGGIAENGNPPQAGLVSGILQSFEAGKDTVHDADGRLEGLRGNDFDQCENTRHHTYEGEKKGAREGEIGPRAPPLVCASRWPGNPISDQSLLPPRRHSVSLSDTARAGRRSL